MVTKLIEFVPILLVLNINLILLNELCKKTAIEPIKMTTQQLKVFQIISGSIMIKSLITYFYMDWKLGYRGSYYFFTKGIFQLSLASTWHFSMKNLKTYHPEKYYPNLHKIFVGVWGIMGVILIVDFLTNCV